MVGGPGSFLIYVHLAGLLDHGRVRVSRTFMSQTLADDLTNASSPALPAMNADLGVTNQVVYVNARFHASSCR